MAISRRALLGAVASGVPFLTSSCASISDYTISKRNCEPLDNLGMPVRGRGKPIRIDMHCHLLNLHDIDEASFLVEREFNLDENASLLFAKLVRSLANKLGHLLEGTALDIGDERGHLDFELGKLNSDPRNRPAWASDGDFCAYASSNQRGQNFRAERLGFQLTGVFSNRIRNAARLMALFPKVDIFTPSMVDLFEDEPKYLKDLEERIIRPHQIRTQINFYSNLNLATNGRFLPLVSFQSGTAICHGTTGIRGRLLLLDQESDQRSWIHRCEGSSLLWLFTTQQPEIRLLQCEEGNPHAKRSGSSQAIPEIRRSHAEAVFDLQEIQCSNPHP
jgi:hypothetical protein